MLILTLIGTLLWPKIREFATSYIENIGIGKKKPTQSNNEEGPKASDTQISDVEKRLEDKLKEIEAAREEERRVENEKREEEKRIKLEQKRAKYEKQVRKKYDLMNGVYEKWKSDRPAKFDALHTELTRILWSEEVHSNLSARLEFAKEAHSYAFGVCDEINSDIHDQSKAINPEKRLAKLTTKITILLENLQREYEIAESEYGDLTRLVKAFWEAMYLSRIQVYFLELAKGSSLMYNMLTNIKDQLSATPEITEEILANWEEFKRIFGEFDNDMDNDAPKLDEIGRIVSQRLALMAAAQQQVVHSVEHQPVPTDPATAAAEVAASAAAQPVVDAAQPNAAIAQPAIATKESTPNTKGKGSDGRNTPE